MPLLPTDGVPSRPRLSSLPSSPLATDFRVKSLIKQISSPLVSNFINILIKQIVHHW